MGPAEPGRRRKKLLVLAPRMPFPFHSGERWVLALLRRLSLRYEVSLFTFLPAGDMSAVAYAMSLERSFLRRVHALAPPARGEVVPADCPELARPFYSEKARAELSRVLGEDPPDLVHVHFFEMAHFIEAIPPQIPVVMTDHDVSHFGTDGSYLRGLGEDDRTSRREAERRRFHAGRMYPRCASVTVLSRADARELERFVDVRGVEIVALSVDVDSLSSDAPPTAGVSPMDLLFVGNYRHFPNEDAAVHLCRDILPRLRERRPSVTLRLAGAWPTPAVSALAGGSVEVTGLVPRLQPYLRSARVFVAPVRLGAGVKGKVLEALAAGLPTVVSPRVAEGFDESAIREAMIVGGGPRDFAAAVDGLLGSAPARALLARRGASAARRWHDDSRAAEGFERIYERVLGGLGAQASVVGRAASVRPGPETVLRVLDELEKSVSLGRARSAALKNEPIRELYLETTHRCDLRCVMCERWRLAAEDPSSVAREMTAGQLDSALAGSRLLGELEQVVVTGGEPWLRADIVEILGSLRRRFPAARMIVLTHLKNTVLLRRRLGELRDLGVAGLHLGASLDGMATEHDLIRGRRGAFAGLIETTRMLRREFPEIGFGFTFTITPRNYGALGAAFGLAVEELACDFGAQFVVQTDGIERMEWPQGALEAVDRQIEDIMGRLCAGPVASRDVSELLAGRARPGARLWRELIFWSRLRRTGAAREDLMSDCLSGRRYAMLDPEGNVFFCPVGRKHIVGNVLRAPFDDIWTSPEARSERERISPCRCKSWIRCIAHPIVDRLLSAAGR